MANGIRERGSGAAGPVFSASSRRSFGFTLIRSLQRASSPQNSSLRIELPDVRGRIGEVAFRPDGRDLDATETSCADR
jgi:hypothetical protein